MKVIIDVRLDKEIGEVWLWRELELSFLPSEKMTFQFALLGASGDSRYKKHGNFVVQDVMWVEADEMLHVWLDLDDPDVENLGVSDFDHSFWKEGENSPWLK